MVLVFDLDDTLYDEVTFVFSGFHAVAGHIANEHQVEKSAFYHDLVHELKGGRGHIFDLVLKKHNLFSKARVSKCIAIYRGHKPNISLYKDAIPCLKRFGHISKYIVTDGNKIVQQNKINALQIEQYFSHCFISRRYGVHHEKPSPYLFQKITQLEGTIPGNVVYVGDNPNKDFVGIKPLGFKTIRIMKGNHRDVVKTAEFEAHLRINSLSELTPELLKEHFGYPLIH